MSTAPTRQEDVPGNGQGSRILVVGCGFIGTHVVESLAAEGRAPVVLTRSRPQPAVASLIEDLHVGDASEPEVVEAALEGVAHVVFSAGGLLPAASEQDPDLDRRLTLVPVRAVLGALESRPGVGLTYLSSGGTVYGEPDRVPVGEDAPTHPAGAYGTLHLACEEEVIRNTREHGLRATILRCSSVYGEHQAPGRGQGAIVTFLDRIERGVPVEIYGDGSTVRDYVYAGDVADAICRLLDRDDAPTILNLGAGTGTELGEVLRLVEEEVGHGAEVIRHPARDFEVRQIVLDTTRLRSLIEFEPTPLPDGIARTHAWLAARAEAA